MGTILLQDLPPYVTAAGNPARPRTINAEGLKRRGFSSTSVAAIKRAFKTLYKNGLALDEARNAIALAANETVELAPLVEFLADNGRGLIR
jgi:UDP-N-acetylglucosamine acyltransferase